MNTIDVTLHLPEELVERASAAGVLTDERVAGLIEAEVERQASVTRYAQTVAQLRTLEPPLSEDEIEAEITAHRAEKAGKSGL